MINDECNSCYQFAIKNLPELNSLGWLQGKKEAIVNNNNNDFENALDSALNYQTIEKDPQRISRLEAYINQYNWKALKFPEGPEEWKKFERNNKAIALNILYVKYNTKTKSVACRSEYNNKYKKQVVLLMITNGKKYHYFAVTTLSYSKLIKSPQRFLLFKLL